MELGRSQLLESGLEKTFPRDGLSWAQLERGTFNLRYGIFDAAPLEVSRREMNLGFAATAHVTPQKCIVGFLAAPSTRARLFGCEIGATMVTTLRFIDLRTSGQASFYQIALDERMLQRDFPSTPDVLNLLETVGRFELRIDPDNVNRLRSSLDALFVATAGSCDAAQREPTPKQIYGTLIPQLATTLATQDTHAVEASRCLTQRLIAVRACEAYLREHVDATLLDLSHVSGMESRRLINAFRAVTGFSPMDYLKRLRLNGARRELLGATSPKKRVTQVATDWGFWHLGHFATDYHAMFGETPSQTLSHS